MNKNMSNEETIAYWRQTESILSLRADMPIGERRISGLVCDALNEPGLPYMERYMMLARAARIASCLPEGGDGSRLRELVENTKAEVDRRYAQLPAVAPKGSGRGQ